MNSNWDKYLDPPDTPEEEYCESCGVPLEYMLATLIPLKGELRCTNKCCPEKHTGVAKEIAVELADTRASLEDMKRKNIHLIRLIKIYDPEFEY